MYVCISHPLTFTPSPYPQHKCVPCTLFPTPYPEYFHLIQLMKRDIHLQLDEEYAPLFKRTRISKEEQPAIQQTMDLQH